LRTRAGLSDCSRVVSAPRLPVCCTASNLPGPARIHTHFQGNSRRERLANPGAPPLTPRVARATARRAPGRSGMLIYSCGTTRLRYSRILVVESCAAF